MSLNYPVTISVTFQVKAESKEQALEKAENWLDPILQSSNPPDAKVRFLGRGVPYPTLAELMNAQRPWYTVSTGMLLQDTTGPTEPAPSWLRKAIEETPTGDDLRVIMISDAIATSG